MDSKENIVKSLLGASTVARRKAAKQAAQFGKDLCGELLDSLRIERHSKNWQTKVELLKALGALECRGAIELVREMVYASSELEYDLVKMCVSTAFIRLSRANLNDPSPVWEMMELGGYSVKEGALEAVGYDRMIFDDPTSEALIVNCWDFGHDRPRGYTDPRYGLAAACAGWSQDVARNFLIHCLDSNDAPLCYVVKKSLQGLYVGLR